MLYLNSIKNSSIRGKKISHMENSENAGVLTLSPEKRWGNARDCIGFRAKNHHMVGNIYNALEFASLQNLVETCNKNRSSALLFDTIVSP